MKAKLMVHPSYAKEILSPAEQERLAALGWVFAQPRPRNKERAKDAKTKRTRRETLRAAGYHQLNFWLSPAQLAAVKAALRPGEGYAELVTRLAHLSLL